MTKGIEGGFLASDENDALIDKFIDSKGNISEEELAKLEGKEHEQKEQKPDDERAEVESDEEPREDEESDEIELAEKGQGEEGEKSSEPDEDAGKRKAESNQTKAIRIERERRKDLEKQLRLQAERSSKIEQVLTKVLQPQADAQSKENVPDAEEDPIGYQNYKIAKLEQLQQQQQQYQQQQQEYARQVQQREQFVGAYAQSAKEYAVENPQFMDAYKHLVQSRLNEHLAAGYDENTANELLKQEEAAIVDRAFRNGENPAERIFKVAQARGYSYQAPQPEKKPVSKLESVKQGLRTSKALGPTQGDARDMDNLNISDIDSMSDEEVDRLWNLAKTGKVNFN